VTRPGTSHLPPDAPLTPPPPPAGTAPESVRVRATRAIAWNLLGTLFNQGSTFLANLALANLLGVALFGEYAMVQSTIVVFSVLGQMAVGYTATKYVAELRVRHPERTGRLIGWLAAASGVMATVATVALALSAPWIASVILHAPGVSEPLLLAAGVLFFTIANGFLTGALAGLEAYAVLGRIGVVSGSVYLAAALSGGALGSVPGVIIGIALSGSLQWGLLSRALRAEARRQGIVLQLRLDARDTGIVARFALPAALNGFVSVPAIWFGNALLVRQSGGFDAMALFAAANSFRIIVLFLPNIVNNVNMALLNNQKGVEDRRGYRRVFWANLAATSGIVLAGGLVIGALGPWLLAAFGPEFRVAYPVLLVLMLATIPESLSLALLQVVQSHERMWFTFWGVNVPSYGVLAVLAWWLIPEHGPTGLAWAYAAGWTVAFGANLMMVRRLGVDIVARQR
jgi:O-antigen/teichoic acid export membrane protein